MSNLSTQIGQRIRSYRLKSGFNQEELAEKCGLHPTYIGQVERGEKNATIESISKIAAGLSLPLSTLFENIDGIAISQNENYPAQVYDLMLSLPKEQQETLFNIMQMIIRLK